MTGNDAMKKDIDQLNEFLRNELSAVETYEQCIEKVDDTEISQGLVLLKNSHQERVAKLTQRVQQLGGEPSSSAGAWGALTKLLEGGAKLFGEDSALSMLEEGEDKGRDDYQKHLDDLLPENKAFIQGEILPEQKRSHDQLNNLMAVH